MEHNHDLFDRKYIMISLTYYISYEHFFYFSDPYTFFALLKYSFFREKKSRKCSKSPPSTATAVLRKQRSYELHMDQMLLFITLLQEYSDKFLCEQNRVSGTPCEGIEFRIKTQESERHVQGKQQIARQHRQTERERGSSLGPH